MKLTVDRLRELDFQELDRYKKMFGEELELTEANCLKLAEEGFNITWLAENLLTASLLDKFKADKALLWNKCLADNALLWKKFKADRAPLLDKFLADWAQLWNKYEADKALLLTKYEAGVALLFYTAIQTMESIVKSKLIESQQKAIDNLPSQIPLPKGAGKEGYAKEHLLDNYFQPGVKVIIYAGFDHETLDEGVSEGTATLISYEGYNGDTYLWHVKFSPLASPVLRSIHYNQEYIPKEEPK